MLTAGVPPPTQGTRQLAPTRMAAVQPTLLDRAPRLPTATADRHITRKVRARLRPATPMVAARRTPQGRAPRPPMPTAGRPNTPRGRGTTPPTQPHNPTAPP